MKICNTKSVNILAKYTPTDQVKSLEKMKQKLKSRKTIMLKMKTIKWYGIQRSKPNIYWIKCKNQSIVKQGLSDCALKWKALSKFKKNLF